MKPIKPLFATVLVLGASVLASLPQRPMAQPKVETVRAIKPMGSAVNGKIGQSTSNQTAAASTRQEAVGCLIEPQMSAQVAASAPGVLAEVRVNRGDIVKRGQILALLDSGVEEASLNAASVRAEIRSQIATARASRDMARQKFTRVKKLESLSYGAKLELELAAGELAVAEHRLQQAIDNSRVARHEHLIAKKQLEQRLVRSPIDGIIADRLLNPGERADGRPIVRVIRLDNLKVEVIIPASRFGKIKTGMNGTVTPNVPDAVAGKATVVQVDRFIDAASGTFRARLAMTNPDLSVPAGVRCDVSFDNNSRQLDKS